MSTEEVFKKYSQKSTDDLKTALKNRQNYSERASASIEKILEERGVDLENLRIEHKFDEAKDGIRSLEKLFYLSSVLALISSGVFFIYVSDGKRIFFLPALISLLFAPMYFVAGRISRNFSKFAMLSSYIFTISVFFAVPLGQLYGFYMLFFLGRARKIGIFNKE